LLLDRTRFGKQSGTMSTIEQPTSPIPVVSLPRLFAPRRAATCWPRLAWAVLLLILPAICQGSDLAQLLSGKAFPLAMKLKDLNGDWRRVTLRGNGSITGNMSVNVSGNSESAVSQNNLTGSLGGGQTYVTQGRTASANEQTYLIAYHLPLAGLDLSILLQAIAAKTPPEAAALTPESTLGLSLLNVRAIGSLEDVSPFDLKRELSQSENAIKALTALLKSSEGSQKKENKPTGEKAK
jgi:hypothetical protein